MKYKPTNIKGGFDSGPAEMILRNRITDILRKNFEAYGYMPLETAMLNYLELLTYKYDPDAEIVREIYKIRDQGDRDLGLRFDLTVPFCKYIALNQNMKLPFKRYEIGKVWRNGPVKSGRTREFYQCDIDAVGIHGAHIEAEMISMAVKILLDLGITPIVKYNSRKLLPQDDKIIAIIDRMDKDTPEEIIKALSKHMTGEEAKTLVERLNTPSQERGTLGELGELESALAELGVLQYCVFTPSLARGLNVYTGTVWEIYDKDARITSAIGAGGRYDKIIGNFIDNGNEYPAVGLSLGLESLMAVLKTTEKARTLIDSMLVPLGTESFCQKIANDMRAEGKNVLVYLGGKSIAKAFEYASSYGIKSVAVVGEDEKNGKPIVFKEIK